MRTNMPTQNKQQQQQSQPQQTTTHQTPHNKQQKQYLAVLCQHGTPQHIRCIRGGDGRRQGVCCDHCCSNHHRHTRTHRDPIAGRFWNVTMSSGVRGDGRQQRLANDYLTRERHVRYLQRTRSENSTSENSVDVKKQKKKKKKKERKNPAHCVIDDSFPTHRRNT